MVSDVDESEPESVVEAIDNEDDENDDDASEPDSLIILNPDLKLSCCLNQRRALKVS